MERYLRRPSKWRSNCWGPVKDREADIVHGHISQLLQCMTTHARLQHPVHHKKEGFKGFFGPPKKRPLWQSIQPIHLDEAFKAEVLPTPCQRVHTHLTSMKSSWVEGPPYDFMRQRKTLPYSIDTQWLSTEPLTRSRENSAQFLLGPEIDPQTTAQNF